MQVAMVGLGRMGGAMAERLLEGGHRVVVYNRSPEPVERLAEKGAVPTRSLVELVGRLDKPRVVWLMLPAGSVTGETVERLSELLESGDILVDGGNSFYRESQERAERLRPKGIHYLDVGTSGGIWGLKEGYGLMVGGDREAFESIEPLLSTLSYPEGYGWLGPSGAGHFVKMVHNGIEYGLLEAYAEGFEILRASPFQLDLGGVAKLWNRGSVIRSWLLKLAEDAFARDPDLSDIAGYVADTGEGRWTVTTAIDLDVPAPVITLSLLGRLRSRQEESFAAKVIAALRREFGGHAVREARRAP